MTQINQKIKNVLTNLRRNIPTTICWAVTGSISLKLNGDTNREIKDIDIAILEEERDIIENFIKFETSATVTDGSSSDCYSVMLDDVKVDFIVSKPDDFKDVKVMIIPDVGNFTILKSKHSISAKKGYVDHYIKTLYDGDNLNDKQMNNLIKHLNDINSFNQNKKVGYIGNQINLNNIENILKGLPS